MTTQTSLTLEFKEDVDILDKAILLSLLIMTTISFHFLFMV